jgi:hypothetical protein
VNCNRNLLIPFQRGGLHRDGCALFVNKDRYQSTPLFMLNSKRFKVKAYTTVDYNSLQVENATGWANMLRYKKDNVGILMLLEIVSTSQLFCVATTHLYWYSIKPLYCNLTTWKGSKAFRFESEARTHAP